MKEENKEREQISDIYDGGRWEKPNKAKT